MKFSLVIPCYNEAESLEVLIERCKTLVKKYDFEVIFVDNGSTDKTYEILHEKISENKKINFIKVEKNIGYGHGILAGLKEAKGKFIGWTHADLQTDPLDCIKAIEFLDTKKSKIFIKGRRYGRPFLDICFTLGMSIFETILLRRFLFDINAQPTLFSRELFENWVNPPTDFSLDLYAYYDALSKDYTVFRFPVKFTKRIYGHSHWNINWSSKWKFIKRTIKFSFDLRKKYFN